MPLSLALLSKCDSSSRIIYFPCLLTNFCWVVSCAKHHPHLKMQNVITRDQITPLPSVGLVEPACTQGWTLTGPFQAQEGGEASAHLGQGLWQVGGDEPWPGIAGGNLSPCQSGSFGSATATCGWSRLFPNPDTWQTPETCTKNPDFLASQAAVAVSYCYGSSAKLCLSLAHSCTCQSFLRGCFGLTFSWDLE